jgi:hypothetical protein
MVRCRPLRTARRNKKHNKPALGNPLPAPSRILKVATNLNQIRRGAPGSGCQASTFGNSQRFPWAMNRKLYVATFITFAAAFVPVLLNFGIVVYAVPAAYIAFFVGGALVRGKLAQAVWSFGHPGPLPACVPRRCQVRVLAVGAQEFSGPSAGGSGGCLAGPVLVLVCPRPYLLLHSRRGRDLHLLVRGFTVPGQASFPMNRCLRTQRMRATACVATVVSTTFPARRRLIRDVNKKCI